VDVGVWDALGDEGCEQNIRRGLFLAGGVRPPGEYTTASPLAVGTRRSPGRGERCAACGCRANWQFALRPVPLPTQLLTDAKPLFSKHPLLLPKTLPTSPMPSALSPPLCPPIGNGAGLPEKDCDASIAVAVERGANV